MKVYNLHVGCRYEGGSTVAVFLNKEKALQEAMKLAKETSDRMSKWEDDEFCNYETKEERKEKWKLNKIKDGFEVGHDIYVVEEMEVIE